MSQEIYQIEIKNINDWCLTIINAVVQRVGEVNPILTVLKDNILKSPSNYSKKMLAACRSRQRDINEWALGLPEEDQIIINKALFEKFNRNLLTHKKEAEKMIAKVLKSGLIRTPLEYQIMEQTVSELSQTQPDSDKIPVLNKLLIQYSEQLKG